MANIQDLINLAKADGGKFFVIDETGEPSLVIMSVEQYQELLLSKVEEPEIDVENINQEILKAQLSEPEEFISPKQSSASQRSFVPKAFGYSGINRQPDLRAEVIDPSFDFEMPKGESDDF
ncbi:MAG: hypothetical protein JNN11_02665 [Candidatus Doudnabacteria bacterium]|nr:hypothetical protein [Candidatus Doudnabacteria bacterium]